MSGIDPIAAHNGWLRMIPQFSNTDALPWLEIGDRSRLPQTPMVSVAMLAYNHEAYLAEAIQGVLMQEAPFRFELVVGVDVSSDRTLALARDFQARNPERIRVMAAHERLGMHRNCVGTLGACRGLYTAICEGDDFWTDSQKLAKQVAILEADPSFEGCFHDCHVLVQATRERRVRIGRRAIDAKADLASIIREKNITTCSMMYRNRLEIGDLASLGNGIVQLDYLICLLVAEKGPWRYLAETMAVYRSHDGGVWGGTTGLQRARQDVAFFGSLLCHQRFVRFHTLVRSAIRSRRRSLSAALARDGQLGAATFEYLRSIGDKRGFESSSVSTRKLAWDFGRGLSARLGVTGIVRRLRGASRGGGISSPPSAT